MDLIYRGLRRQGRIPLPGGNPSKRALLRATHNRSWTAATASRVMSLTALTGTALQTSTKGLGRGLRRSGWRLLIEGETPIDINVTFPIAADKVPLRWPGITPTGDQARLPVRCCATEPRHPNDKKSLSS